ncbi:MAG: condensation domain-containing protein, partial [Acidobacteria bacterium]|nr:condensation domain-containing protein [Acidobacteriota bacterium]
KPFSQYLQEVKEKMLNAFQNQEYQFEELISKLDIQRKPGRHPLVDVVFAFQEVNNSAHDGESRPSSLDPSRLLGLNISHFDLMFQAIDNGPSLFIIIEYSTALYKRATIEEFSRVYRQILDQIVLNNNIQLVDIKISHGLLTAQSDFSQSDKDEWEL